MTIKKDLQFFLRRCLMQSVILLVILLVPAVGLSQTKNCKNDGQQLQGGFDVIQAKGGLWAYFERSQALKDNSMLGMQADSKLQRAVVIFQEKCLDKSTPPPSSELYKKISDALDIARAINNKSSTRSPQKKIVSSIKDLIKTLDTLIKN